MAASRRIPVLVTLHDFYFACPLLHLEKRDGRPCDGPDGGRECALTCFARGRGARAGLWTARAGWFEHLLETCSGLLAPSADVAGYFERHTQGRPVSVLENGVFFGDRPTPRGASRETLRLAVLGAVLPHKGAHTVVAALGGLGLPVELTLHGPTPDRRYARRLVADARTDPLLELHLAGPYEPAELPSRLDGVDVVVVASQVREGSPLAPREALALGIPVVASRVGGLTELVSHELNGLLFDPRDPRGLPDALRRIASDPDLRTRLAAGARNTAVRRLADHVVELREVYARALPAEVDDATADRLFAPLRSGAAT
jgi:glycosyltransferase involved in cell wall biosynthesis